MAKSLVDGIQDICEEERCSEPVVRDWDQSGVLWIQHGQAFFHWRVGKGSHREARNLRRAILDWMTVTHGGLTGYIERLLEEEAA